MFKIPVRDHLVIQMMCGNEKIDPRLTHGEWEIENPCIDLRTFAAQKRHHEISGKDRIHYCSASWGNGLHEGGVQSALRVGEFFGKNLETCRWRD
jgi:uncharacterized protein